jgi:hypothetical protein
MRTLYEILGVPSHATQAELKAAWRRAAMKWHPDRNRGREHHAQAEFQRINDAYAALTNPLRRAQYDLTLNAGPRQLGERPRTNWQRLVRDARHAWRRLVRGNTRSLPHSSRHVRQFTRSQWLMGVSAAMLAAVLLTDAAVDDAPLRSSFVSRQHAQHAAAATPAAGSRAPERETRQASPVVAANQGEPSETNTFTTASSAPYDGTGSAEPDAPVVATTIAPGVDPALDEVHASLADWRAEQAQHDDVHERGHDGTHADDRASGGSEHNPGGAATRIDDRGATAASGVNLIGGNVAPPMSAEGASAARADVTHGLAAANRAAASVKENVAHAADTVRVQVHDAGAEFARQADALAQASGTRAVDPKHSADAVSAKRADAPDRHANASAAATGRTGAAATGRTGAAATGRTGAAAKSTATKAATITPHRVLTGMPPQSAAGHADGASGTKPPLAGVTRRVTRPNDDATAPYGFSPRVWQYNGGAGS